MPNTRQVIQRSGLNSSCASSLSVKADPCQMGCLERTKETYTADVEEQTRLQGIGIRIPESSRHQLLGLVLRPSAACTVGEH